MDDVYYLKLISGEEVIATKVNETEDSVFFENPMIIETGVDVNDETRRYVYFTRWAPYQLVPNMSVHRGNIIHFSPANQVTAHYYEVSLAYCRQIMDGQFEKCLAGTVSQIESTLAETEAAPRSPLEKMAAVELILSRPSSNSYH